MGESSEVQTLAPCARLRIDTCELSALFERPLDAAHLCRPWWLMADSRTAIFAAFRADCGERARAKSLPFAPSSSRSLGIVGYGQFWGMRSSSGLVLGSDDRLAVAEADAAHDLGEAIGAVQAAPVPLGRPGELEDQGERGLSR